VWQAPQWSQWHACGACACRQEIEDSLHYSNLRFSRVTLLWTCGHGRCINLGRQGLCTTACLSGRCMRACARKMAAAGLAVSQIYTALPACPGTMFVRLSEFVQLQDASGR
jgi:hypothetical protein